mmetsp:Transcript_69431/g.175009  ORF Transcript_69431/g.175009 Transcript_69431/m.175009 type:complete len:264 (-) Transcript_69431:3-794(-)
MRSPSRNKLKVLAFGLLGSKLTTTAITWSRVNLCEAGVFFLPTQNEPSESKQTWSSLSPSTKGEFEVEKPTRSSCRGAGARPRPPPAEDSAGFNASTIFTSNMYLPAFTPTLARAPAMRYCIPPSESAMSTFPSAVGSTFSVTSDGLKPIASLSAGRLSAGASFSFSSASASAASFLTALASFFGGSSFFSSALRFSGAALAAGSSFFGMALAAALGSSCASAVLGSSSAFVSFFAAAFFLGAMAARREAALGRRGSGCASGA